MRRFNWVLFAIVVVLLIGAGFGIRAWTQRSMGQPLALQTPVLLTPTSQMQSAAIKAEPLPTSTVKATMKPTAAQALHPTQVAQTCGNTGQMKLLVVGLTTPTGEEILGADAIRLVTIDFDKPSVAILTLPTLLWVDSPALTDIGVNQIQLTMTYTKAYMAAKGESEEARHHKATQVLAQTIVDNFGYVPDHYIVIDDAAFIKYIDELGGIDINLEKAVDGRMEGYGVYPAGSQRLDGKRTLDFARLFHPDGIRSYDVWGNLSRQNMIVKGILAATLKPQNWTKIPKLIAEVEQAVITDLSIDQALDLVCMVKQAGDETRMLVVDETMVSQGFAGRMTPDKVAIKNLIAELDNP